MNEYAFSFTSAILYSFYFSIQMVDFIFQSTKNILFAKYLVIWRHII